MDEKTSTRATLRENDNKHKHIQIVDLTVVVVRLKTTKWNDISNLTVVVNLVYALNRQLPATAV